MTPKTVGEIMSSPVLTVAPGDDLKEAMMIMTNRRVGALVVSEGQRPIGIITERDILRHLAKGGRMEDLVGDVMTKELVSCTPDTPILRAFLLMYDKRIRRLPILGEDGALIGIITMRDLVKWVVQLLSPQLA